MWILDVFAALQKAKISYAVVGGYAVALHGVVRGTVDLDLVIAFDRAQFIAVENLLKKIGFQSRLPVTAKEVFEFRKEYIQNRNLIAWNFFDPTNSLKQIDVLLTEDVRKLDVVTLKIMDQSVRVISKKDLIRIKTKSGRPQDLEDVEALSQLGDLQVGDK